MEESKDPVGTEETTASGNSQGDQKDTVAYDSYRKVLNEKKQRDQRLAEMQEQIKTYEQKELEKQGEFEKVIASLREENSGLKNTIAQERKAIYKDKVRTSVKSKAVELGCTNPDKLLKLIDDKEIESLEVDEFYNPKAESLEFLVSEAKKDNDFLFKKGSVNVQDGTPVKRPVASQGKKVSDMTRSEIEELYKNTYR